MEQRSNREESVIQFVYETEIGKKSRSLEPTLKRVKFDLTIQQTSDGNFDEEGYEL